MRVYFSLILVPIILLLSGKSYGGPSIYVINRDHSYIEFSVPFMKVSSVKGGFNNFSGKIEISDKEPYVIKKLFISINTNSISTNNKQRDHHLKQDDFFNVKKFPVIEFSSHNITPLKNKDQQQYSYFNVSGILKIKDKNIPIDFKIRLDHQLKDTWNQTHSFIQIEEVLNRNELGVNWNKSIDAKDYLIGDLVSVKGVFEIQPQGEETAYSKYKIPANPLTDIRERASRGEDVQVQQIELEENIKENTSQKDTSIKELSDNAFNDGPSAYIREDITREAPQMTITIMISLAFLIVFNFIGIFVSYLAVKTYSSQKKILTKTPWVIDLAALIVASLCALSGFNVMMFLLHFIRL